jgi:hypothetical protein
MMASPLTANLHAVVGLLQPPAHSAAFAADDTGQLTVSEKATGAALLAADRADPSIEVPPYLA